MKTDYFPYTMYIENDNVIML